ncbi:MAG: TIGR03013 family PEP-CTERM/XrtA system glycosyltransferase [Nitrospirae bacterium]|nr:TIGR03013 family PEP-CTERM/XrtA system glycosyltransferase [Nitrospirota bacterium]
MERFFNRYPPLKGIAFFGAESLLIYLSVLTAISVRSSFDTENILANDPIFLKVFLIMLTCQAILFYNGLYTTNTEDGYRKPFIKIFQSLGVAALLLTLLYYLFPSLTVGRGIFILTLFILPVILLIWRLFYGQVASVRSIRERVLIVGAGDLAKEIGKRIVEKGYAGYRVVGYIDEDPLRVGQSMFNPKIIGDYLHLFPIVKKEKVDRVIVALPDRRGKFPTSALLKCKLDGVEIEDGVSFYEQMNGKILVSHLKPGWLIFSDGFKRRGMAFAKRFMDIMLAGLGLLLSSPILLVTALLIKLDSKGPVFFRQKRVGQDSRIFTLLKFRSMSLGAERESGPVWAKIQDSRTTRVGKWIRKTRIDEIPQMINVLRGEMSFVGPRPERPYFIARLRKQLPYYMLRHTVKPGITGWAQVRYPYGASVRDALEKLEYDLYYIKNMSFLFDITIVLETFKTVLFGKGAR